PWNSTISFAAGISVALGGTLDLEIASDSDAASLVGMTFQVFDWSHVNPTGEFLVDSPYTWDLSQLYTTGNIKLIAMPEPSSLGLLAMGSVFVLGTLKRKRA